jgi:hypothetical protein
MNNWQLIKKDCAAYSWFAASLVSQHCTLDLIQSVISQSFRWFVSQPFSPLVS